MRHPFWIDVWPRKKLWWFLWEKEVQCFWDDRTLTTTTTKKGLGGMVRVGKGQSLGTQMNTWAWTGAQLIVLGKVNSAPWGTQGYEL